MTQTPYVLAFDTANEVITIGLGRLEQTSQTVECIALTQLKARRASNTKLLLNIDEICKKSGVDRGDIVCVAAGQGPGSFTGVRIALATAKGIASALGVALVGISTLDALAWNVWDSGVRGSLLVVADAMRNEIYPARFELSDEAAVRKSRDCVMKVDLFEADLGHELFITGDALARYAEVFDRYGTLLSEDLWYPTGKSLLLALQAAWQAGDVDPFDAARHNPSFALPVYTRLSDAEEGERVRLARNDEGQMIQDQASFKSAARGSRHVTMNDMAIANMRSNESGIAFKPLDRTHAGCVADLEARIMGSDAWSEALVAGDLGQADRIWWAAYAADPSMPLSSDAPLIGYAGGMVIDDDVQILRVGVDPAWRRSGIARMLLAHLVSDARNLGALTCSLEVRCSNEGAQAFYRELGFSEVGIRPHYYSDREDALIMSGTLSHIEENAYAGVAGMTIQHFEDDMSDVAAACNNAADDNVVGGSATTVDSTAGIAGTADAVGTASTAGADETRTVANGLAAKPPLILAIESSCDETAAALVNGEGTLAADVVASQIDFHARFGGVVPEIASRKHIEAICGVCEVCLDTAAQHMGLAHLNWCDLDAVAVTYTPGLVGALVVGVAFAKGVAWAADIPFIGVNHLEGHLYANKLGDSSFAPPAVVSLVSGGNTMLVYMRDWGDYVVLGATIDDAVGEAFDKVAKALGLGYPGGSVISRYAAEGDPSAIDFPRAMMHSGDMNFSLSGLKTAVVTYINQERIAGHKLNIADIAAGFQQAVIDVQVKKARMALEQTGAPIFCIGGGVAANTQLRAAYEDLCSDMGVKLVMPPLHACGDNAGMIALVALDRYREGKFFELDADAVAQSDLETSY